MKKSTNKADDLVEMAEDMADEQRYYRRYYRRYYGCMAGISMMSFVAGDVLGALDKACGLLGLIRGLLLFACGIGCGFLFKTVLTLR